MRIFVIIALCIVIIGYLVGNVFRKELTPQKKMQEVVSLSVAPVLSNPTSPTTSLGASVTETASIFVPYWAAADELKSISTYNRIIYFGISPTISGINRTDEGFVNLSSFTANVPQAAQQLLAFKMLDQNVSRSILEHDNRWEPIVNEALTLAKDHGFDGIVLDLELSALPFTDVTSNITQFVHYFSSRAKEENLHFAMTIYGDTFYRKRPYDIAVLSESVDEMMVMAYDFHKAGGEPGPNFPLRGKEKYGYDLEQLVHDFENVPRKKLTFVFGMYGYDWIVDETKKPIKPAKALSLNDIRSSFVDTCEWKNCVVLRDTKRSFETEVNYIDKVGNYHIVWFEDMDSVAEKKKYLKEQGIWNFAFWTYGYF